MKEKIIFLDRDGVINKDLMDRYVENWDDFEFYPGSLNALKKLTEVGYKIFVISNQAGISKGKYTFDDLNHITENMLRIVKENGGKITDVVYCPHQDEDNCNCRKPEPGMFKKITEKHSLDFNCQNSFFIGDNAMDIEAGSRFGLNTILVLSGKSKKENIKNWEYKPDYIKKDLLDAVEFLLAKANKNR